MRGDGAALRGGAAAAGSRAAGRLRAGLVAGQIALSVVLLCGAGLLVRTVERLLDEEGGFEPRQALTARLMLADTSFIEGGAQAQTAFVSTLLERVRGLPGVQAAGVGSVLPPASLLYGVSPYDPATLAAVAAVVVLTALAAATLPARRAARLDPMLALRAE